MRVVALVGSNRGEKSTSASMVNYLAGKLEAQATQVDMFFSRFLCSYQETFGSFLKEVKESDFFIVSAPVYVDLLPAPLIQVLEEIRGRVGRNGLKGKKMLAIIHSGYPEPQQRKPGLEMCRLFAREMGMEWCGGLSFGGTSPINGEPLEKMGGMAKGIRTALDHTAENLTNREADEFKELVLEDKSTIPIPSWMVKLMMNAMTRNNARKTGIKDLKARPYSTQGKS